MVVGFVRTVWDGVSCCKVHPVGCSSGVNTPWHRGVVAGVRGADTAAARAAIDAAVWKGCKDTERYDRVSTMSCRQGVHRGGSLGLGGGGGLPEFHPAAQRNAADK